MKNPANNYQRQAILNSSPEQLIIKLYDFGIQACHRQDLKRVLDVLSVLINSLNFEYELSAELYQLYTYCQEQVREGEYDEVREILSDLRDTWQEHVVNGEPLAINNNNMNNKRGFVV